MIDELLTPSYTISSLGQKRKKLGRLWKGERVQFKGDLSAIELRQAFQSVDAVVHAGALSTAWGPWKASIRRI